MLELWYQTNYMAPRYKLGFEFADDQSGRLHADMFAMAIYEVMETLGHDKPVIRITAPGVSNPLVSILGDAVMSEAPGDLPANLSFFPVGKTPRPKRSRI